MILTEKKIEGYFDRWRIFWIGVPGSFVDHFLSVELSSLWRRHLIWSKPAGKLLREALTQRFASVTVFLSLILGTEIRVLFSPSKPANDVRDAMEAKEYTLEYWTGIALALSIFFSIAALVANFTAWGIFTVIGDANLKLVARSSIGLYGAQLPNRLVVCVIYMFYIWVSNINWGCGDCFRTKLFINFSHLPRVGCSILVDNYAFLHRNYSMRWRVTTDAPHRFDVLCASSNYNGYRCHEFKPYSRTRA